MEYADQKDNNLKIKYLPGVGAGQYKAYVYDARNNILVIARDGQLENIFRPTAGKAYFDRQPGRLIDQLNW